MDFVLCVVLSDSLCVVCCASQQTEEEMRLLRYQHQLEERLNRPYQDLSLHQTIHRLLVDSDPKLADQLRKEFKVPDRRCPSCLPT